MAIEEDKNLTQMILRPRRAQAAGAGPITATALSSKGCSGGREAQSIALFKTPE